MTFAHALSKISHSALPFLLLGGALMLPTAHAWDASGRFDNNGNYLDPASGHTAACLRYESGFVAPATIGGLVNGVEMEQRAKAQLADTQPGIQGRGVANNSVITINPNVLPPQHTTHWMMHSQNGHMMIGGQ